MVSEAQPTESKDQFSQGAIVRLAGRVAALLFVVVLAVSLWKGEEPAGALLRALAALLVTVACGWLCERLAALGTGRSEQPVDRA